MFWEHSDYTYEEATKAYDRDGTLAQFVKPRTYPSDDINGLPPKHSMYWQGDTSKLDIPSTPQSAPPTLLDLVPKKKPEKADAHFIPVRYAIDQMDDPDTTPAQRPFGLPEDWQGEGPLSNKLKASSYTLRQLRDGWLYIYNKTTNTIDEYQFEGDQFTYYQPLPNENPDLEARGEKQPSNTYLSYPKGSVLSLMYSPHRWTWTKYLYVLKCIGAHKQHMQTIILTDEHKTKHIGPIEQLAQVADIEVSPIEDGRFSLSSVVTQASEEEEEGGDIACKPIASVDSLTASLPEGEPAFVVAIHDLIADGQDLAAKHAYYASSYKFVEQQTASQWALMQTVMTLTMFGASDETRFPYSIKKAHREIEFYADMAKYYQNKQESDGELQKSHQTPYHTLAYQNTVQATQEINLTQSAQAIQDKPDSICSSHPR